jgi:hypothetical protein
MQYEYKQPIWPHCYNHTLCHCKLEIHIRYIRINPKSLQKIHKKSTDQQSKDLRHFNSVQLPLLQDPSTFKMKAEVSFQMVESSYQYTHYFIIILFIFDF